MQKPADEKLTKNESSFIFHPTAIGSNFKKSSVGKCVFRLLTFSEEQVIEKHVTECSLTEGSESGADLYKQTISILL